MRYDTNMYFQPKVVLLKHVGESSLYSFESRAAGNSSRPARKILTADWLERRLDSPGLFKPRAAPLTPPAAQHLHKPAHSDAKPPRRPTAPR